MKHILTILTLLALFSCRTMKKNYSEEYHSLDSAANTVAQQTSVKTDNSTITKKEVEKATGNNVKITLTYGIDSGKTKIDVVKVPLGFQNKGGINAIVQQLLNERLRQVEIQGDFSLTKKVDTEVRNDIKDSTGKKDSSHVDVQAKGGKKTGVKEVKGISFFAALFGSLWFWLIIAIVLILIYLKHKSKIMTYAKNKIAGWLSILVIIITLFSCNNPDGKIYQADSEFDHWEQGRQVFKDFVIIKPTWGQSFYFAFKTDAGMQIFGGVGIFLVGVTILFLAAKKKYITSPLWIWGAFALLCLGAVVAMSPPGEIKWENEIRIEKSMYESRKADLKLLWEDLYKEKRIVGTSGE